MIRWETFRSIWFEDWSQSVETAIIKFNISMKIYKRKRMKASVCSDKFCNDFPKVLIIPYLNIYSSVL